MNVHTWKQRLFRTRAEDSLPLTIEHQRIYIIPTRRGFAFTGAVLLMLLATVNYALSLGYALCFLLVGMFAATLLQTYRNLSRITVQSISAPDCFAGQNACFCISLANYNNRERHGIRISTDASESTRVVIPEHGEQSVVIDINALQRGRLLLGRLTIQSDWPLGLWTTWSFLHTTAQCHVFPEPESDTPPLPVPVGGSNGDCSAIGSGGDVAGVRDYVPGDSPNRIAWRHAARGIGLQVKTFEQPISPERMTLSLQQTQCVELEAQLSRLCAWVLQADALQIDYALQLPGCDIDFGTGALHRHQVLTSLALHKSPG